MSWLSTRDSLLSFWIGSSIVSGAVSIGYIGAGFSRWRASGDWSVGNDVNNFEWMIGAVLVLLGIFNIIAQNLVAWSGGWYWWNLIIGAVFGLVLSSIGRFGFNFPVRVFNFPIGRDWLVHPMAMALYAFVFSTLIGLPSWYFVQKNKLFY